MKVLVLFTVLVALAYAANEAGTSEESAGLDVAGEVTDQAADEHHRHGYGSARPYSSHGHRPYSSHGHRPYSSHGHRPYSSHGHNSYSSHGSRPYSSHGHSYGGGYHRKRRSADEIVEIDQEAAEHHSGGYGGYYGGYSQPYYGGYSQPYYGGYNGGYYGGHHYGGHYGSPYWG